MYYASVHNSVLKNLLGLHIKTLRNHVVIMLALIDPDRQSKVYLPDMETFHINMGAGKLEEYEKDIVLEARSSAKLMVSENFNSALMMKDFNVEDIHLLMSFQDISLQMMYDNLIKTTNGEYIPKVSKERLPLQNLYHVQNEKLRQASFLYALKSYAGSR
jgi:hypothetical protein